LRPVLPGTNGYLDNIMLTIKRTCTNKIITRALGLDGQSLVAILRPDAEDCQPCSDLQQLQNCLNKYSDAIIVYNQHEDSIKLIKRLQTRPAQVFIEIRQDTKGVLGLHAIRINHDRQQTLELVYQ
jgi:hypothetical protein